MKTTLRMQLQVLLLILLLSLFISAAATTTSFLSAPTAQDQQDFNTFFTPTHLSFILSTLGFNKLSSATAAANFSTSRTPLTIFAPSDSSLLTCPSCSLPLLLKQYSVPGFYPLHVLRKLAFGTKIETLTLDYCLTITISVAQDDSKVVFVNGIRITLPDLFNNGVFMIHGLEGLVSQLSPLSCNVERMIPLSFPLLSNSFSFSWAPFSNVRQMLKDATLSLRFSGYRIVGHMLKLMYEELSELNAITVFALDDLSILSDGGHAYLSGFRFHVVPNKRLMAADLERLPRAMVLPTLEEGQELVVTTSGPLALLEINNVKIITLNLLENSRIVVHAVSMPFPQMHHRAAEDYGNGREYERAMATCRYDNPHSILGVQMCWPGKADI